LGEKGIFLQIQSHYYLLYQKTAIQALNMYKDNNTQLSLPQPYSLKLGFIEQVNDKPDS